MLWLAILGCTAIPTCSGVCERVVDECGYGGDVALCEDACADVPTANTARADMKACASSADCGHFAAGECVVTSACEGANQYYLVGGSCLDETKGLRFDGDCAGTLEAGEWGPLGEPTVQPLDDEWALVWSGCTVRLGNRGDCVLPDGGTCDVAVWPVF